MESDTLAAALAAGASAVGVSLTPAQVDVFLRYQQLIARWNTRARLTALTDPLQVVRLHFVDSLLCLRAPIPVDGSVIDIGSGAGFPGIPLAIVRRDLRVTLLESNARKAAFLELATSTLRLSCRVVCERAEVAARRSEFRERFDGAVARAVAALPKLTAWTLPFIRAGGLAVFLKGPSVTAEVAAAAEMIAALGGGTPELLHEALPGGEKRVLVIIHKMSPTPPAHPQEKRKERHR